MLKISEYSLNLDAFPQLPLYHSDVPTDKKPIKKIAVLGATALLSALGIYCLTRLFRTEEEARADSTEMNALNPTKGPHDKVWTRGLPVAVSLENQQANPWALFAKSHTFFKESSNGYIQQRLTKSPSWLTAPIDPIISSFPGFPSGIDSVGNLLFMLDRTNGLQILNITNKGTPTLIGSYKIAGNPNKVQVVGNRAYVVAQVSGTSISGLYIINIASPTNPVLMGTYRTPDDAFGVHIVGSIAYVADYSSLQIVNIATESAPALLGSYSTNTAVDVKVVGGIAYVATGSGLLILNVATPSAPSYLGLYSGYAMAVEVIGSTAFVADVNGGGLLLINIATPSAPTLLSSYSGDFRAVQVVGNTAFAMELMKGLHIFDVANQKTPTLIGSYNTNPPNTDDGVGPVYVIGDTAFIGGNSVGLLILGGLNQLRCIGTPSVIDQGDFVVSLGGTTVQGTSSNSFKLRVGQPPFPITPISQISAKLNQPLNYQFNSGVFFDQDDQTSLVYSVTRQDGAGLPSWLNFNAQNRSLSGTPKAADIATLSYYYWASDSYFPASRISFSLKVEAPPNLVTSLPDILHLKNTLLNLYIDQNAFSDLNSDPLTFSANVEGTSSLPSWLTFSDKGFFTGTPTQAARFNITVNAMDGFGGTASDFFTLVIVDPFTPFKVVAGAKATYQIPSSAFQNMGQVTQYVATLVGGAQLPGWIQFDKSTLTFTATPTAGTSSTINLQIAAKNTLGEEFVQTFEMDVAINVAPVYQNPISTLLATVGNDFKYIIPDSVFVDGNGDSLTFTATSLGSALLPKWMVFDKNTRTFSGKPEPDDTNAYADRIETIAILASDGQETVTGTFNVAVSGESYIAKAVRIGLPILSSMTTVFGLYRKRAWILNPLNKKNYTKENIQIVVGQVFTYPFSCNPRHINEISISALSPNGMKALVYRKFDRSRLVCRKDLKNWVVMPSVMSSWLYCDPINGTLNSYGAVPNLTEISPIRIRALGEAGVILEQFDLEIRDK